jgi:hypothetical protein
MSRIRHWIPSALVLAAAAGMLVYGPIPQLSHYHEFADTRAFFGIPNALDVLSNAGFAIVALWGFVALWPHRHDPSVARAWVGELVFLGALLLTAVGSIWYHLAPDNARLVWDRLPIALACAGLLAAVDADTRETRQPPWIPALLVAAAIASVGWWAFTDAHGVGDLRPYLLLQGAPFLLIPLWQANHGSPRRERLAFGAAIGLYAVAKAAELGDHAIFGALGFMSGHTLKHLLSIAAAAVLVAIFVARVDRRDRHLAALILHSVGIR